MLIAPPWNSLYRPSIQIATLAALADHTPGDPVTPVYGYLDWSQYAVETLGWDPVDFVSVYDTIGEELYGFGVGDWIFGGPGREPAHRTPTPAPRRPYGPTTRPS
ncbi:hypothetical protein AAGT00_00485 (plasmid) [Streptomyces cavourensis]